MFWGNSFLTSWKFLGILGFVILVFALAFDGSQVVWGIIILVLAVADFIRQSRKKDKIK